MARKPKTPPDEPKPKRRANRSIPKNYGPKFSTSAPPAGRPRVYDGPAHCSRAKRLALLGLTDSEIAHQFGLNEETLARWKHEYPEFSKSLNEGKLEADGFVAESHYNRAVGFERPAVKIFMPPGSIDENGNPKPIYAPYMEYYPGDVGAQKNWLFNRQRAYWKDRQQVDVTGTVDHRMAAMTPDERARDAVETMERVRARLAALRALRMIEHDPDEGK